jgi:hypothetical protein
LQSLIPGQKNVNTPLRNPEKVYLLPLQIKLGLIKKMDRYCDGLLYLKNKFPRIGDTKIKEDIYVGPQIRVNTGSKI